MADQRDIFFQFQVISHLCLPCAALKNLEADFCCPGWLLSHSTAAIHAAITVGRVPGVHSSRSMARQDDAIYRGVSALLGIWIQLRVVLTLPLGDPRDVAPE